MLVRSLSLALFVLASCTPKTEGGDAAPASAEAVAAPPVDELEAGAGEPSRAFTIGLAKRAVLGLRSCKVTDTACVDPACPAFQTLEAWGRHSPKPSEEQSRTLGLEIIGDESPVVRCQAADLLQPTSPGQDSSVLRRAASKEDQPVVRAHMIDVGRFSFEQTEDVKQFLLANADHPNELVRLEALDVFLAKPFAAKFPDTFDVVTKKLQKDPSMRVRTALCRRLTHTENEKAIPLLRTYLADSTLPAELGGACFEGLVAAWVSAVRPEKPSRDAYELTMKMLEATPRTKTKPPARAGAYEELIYSADLRSRDGAPSEAFAQWEKAAPWFKKERLAKALESVAEDGNASGGARRGAGAALKRVGAPAATLERIATAQAKLDAAEPPKPAIDDDKQP